MAIQVRSFLVLCGAGLAWGAWSQSNLTTLYGQHEWFALLSAISNADAPALYKGALAAAFNRIDQAEEQLSAVSDQLENPEAAADASDWLAQLYLRQGRYRKAAAQFEDGSPLKSALERMPDQTVGQFQPSVVPLSVVRHRFSLPTLIGGHTAEFFVDTDAGFSFMSESEAKALGVALTGVSLEIHGAGGSPVISHAATVPQLALGDIHLQNVTFLVISDREAVFSGLPLQNQGALGSPVLLAFRSLRFGQGQARIGFKNYAAGGTENLCFDGADPVVRIRFGQQDLPAILDTGAPETEIWQSFAARFPEVLKAGAKPRSRTETSFGVQTRIPERMIRDLPLSVGEANLTLHSAHILLAATTPGSERYYARLGMDVLSHAERLTIDFEAMRLTLK